MVKKNIRADKRAYLDTLALEAEEAAHHGNMTAVYANTKSSLEYLMDRETHKGKNGASIIGEEG